MTSLLTDMSADAGTFHGPQGGFLSLSSDSLSASGTMHSLLLAYWLGNGAVQELANVGWKVVSMAHLRNHGVLKGYALGEDGQVLRCERTGTSRIDIFPSTQHPAGRGPLRKIRPLGSTMVAVGMDRQVYALLDDGQWSSIGPDGTAAKPVTGFEAVCGASTGTFYCAGWRGEIWRSTDGVWLRVESPTDVVVLDLCRHPSGVVYGCGLGGLVIRGAGDTWSVLDQGRFDSNLYSIAAHGERIFAAALDGVYELIDDRLVPCDLGTVGPATAHTLCDAGDVLVSLGAKDILMAENGTWRTIE